MVLKIKRFQLTFYNQNQNQMKTTMRSLKKKPPLLFLLLGLGLSALVAFRPTAPPSPVNATTLSYDVTYQHHYLLPAGEAAPSDPLTLSELQPFNLQWHIERSQVPGQAPITEITFVENSLMEPWMPALQKAVISPDGLQLYDADGQLVAEELHSTASQAMEAMLAATDALNQEMAFAPISGAAIQSAAQAGATVTALSGGALRIAKADRAIVYDPANYALERQVLQNGKIIEQVQQRYQPTAQGTVLPARRLERTTTYTRQGLCVERILKIDYSNYRIDGMAVVPAPIQGLPGTSLPAEQIADINAANITIYPNPVIDQLQLQLPPIFEMNAPIHAEIIDLTGTTLLRKKLTPKGLQANLQIGHLPSGVYLFKVQQKDYCKVSKFIKE
jgi:hypothetical protein